MRKIKKYEISDVYTLMALQDTERGYLDFRVLGDIVSPEIVVTNNMDDYSVYSVKVLIASAGALDSIDLEYYIEELEEAWEAVEAIKETITTNYDVEVI